MYGAPKPSPQNKIKHHPAKMSCLCRMSAAQDACHDVLDWDTGKGLNFFSSMALKAMKAAKARGLPRPGKRIAANRAVKDPKPDKPKVPIELKGFAKRVAQKLMQKQQNFEKKDWKTLAAKFKADVFI